MNRLPLILWSVLAVSVSVHAADPAPITLTVKSYRSLTNLVAKVAEAAAPGSSEGALAGMRQGLGISELKGIHLDRPWQIALWLEGTAGRPNASVRIPTTDYAAFAAGITEGSPLKGAEVSMRQVGDYASVWIPGQVSSETATSSHAAWKPDQIGTAAQTLLLQLTPGEPLRQQLVQGLAMVRMMMPGAMSAAQQGQVPAGIDPKAMADLLGLYFEVFELGLKGLRDVSVAVELSGENLVIRDRVSALAGSELAGWLQGSEGSLDSVLPYALARGPAAFAMRLGPASSLMPTLKKFMRLSLQMQGTPPDSAAVTEMDRLMELMLPSKGGGYLDLENGFQFAAAYEFPGKDPKEVHGSMRQYLQTSMSSIAGESKPYKSIQFEEAKRTVGGVSVDRATMEFNLESPLYQAPQQRQMIESLWPGAKMELEYAVKGNLLFLAAPSLMESLLATSPSAASKPASLTPNTMVWGRINILQLLPMMMKANPMVPEEVKQRFEGLDPAGTDVIFQLDLDGALKGEASVPLKLLQAISKVSR